MAKKINMTPQQWLAAGIKDGTLLLINNGIFLNKKAFLSSDVERLIKVAQVPPNFVPGSQFGQMGVNDAVSPKRKIKSMYRNAPVNAVPTGSTTTTTLTNPNAAIKGISGQYSTAPVNTLPTGSTTTTPLTNPNTATAGGGSSISGGASKRPIPVRPAQLTGSVSPVSSAATSPVSSAATSQASSATANTASSAAKAPGVFSRAGTATRAGYATARSAGAGAVRGGLAGARAGVGVLGSAAAPAAGALGIQAAGYFAAWGVHKGLNSAWDWARGANEVPGGLRTPKGARNFQEAQEIIANKVMPMMYGHASGPNERLDDLNGAMSSLSEILANDPGYQAALSGEIESAMQPSNMPEDLSTPGLSAANPNPYGS